MRLPRLSVALLLVVPALAAADEKKDDDKKKEDPHAVLIGKPAPAFVADFAINGKPLRLAELRGKVVLLDFWAVWCGPCLRTFPHLRDWHREFKGQGLEVVGLTTYYEFADFDREAGKLKRADPKLTRIQEQNMLKDFAAHHKLEHLLLTVPADEADKLFDAYRVSAIPQVVLIDRKGIVRLVKVGGGLDTAREVEARIKELLAEK